MHSAANSTGPGIVIKAILSSKLSFRWLKVFLIPISIKGHNLPFTYSQMSLKINLDKSNFGFCFYSQRGTQDTDCKRSSYIHYPTMCYLTWMQEELMWEWKAMEKAIQFAINKKNQHFHFMHPICINWALLTELYKWSIKYRYLVTYTDSRIRRTQNINNYYIGIWENSNTDRLWAVHTILMHSFIPF